MNDPITDLLAMVGDVIGGTTDAMAIAWDAGYNACREDADEGFDYANLARNPYRDGDAA